jgi:hypothetical protein
MKRIRHRASTDFPSGLSVPPLESLSEYERDVLYRMVGSHLTEIPKITAFKRPQRAHATCGDWRQVLCRIWRERWGHVTDPVHRCRFTDIVGWMGPDPLSAALCLSWYRESIVRQPFHDSYVYDRAWREAGSTAQVVDGMLLHSVHDWRFLQATAGKTYTIERDGQKPWTHTGDHRWAVDFYVIKELDKRFATREERQPIIDALLPAIGAVGDSLAEHQVFAGEYLFRHGMHHPAATAFARGITAGTIRIEGRVTPVKPDHRSQEWFVSWMKARARDATDVLIDDPTIHAGVVHLALTGRLPAAESRPNVRDQQVAATILGKLARTA